MLKPPPGGSLSLWFRALEEEVHDAKCVGPVLSAGAAAAISTWTFDISLAPSTGSTHKYFCTQRQPVMAGDSFQEPKLPLPQLYGYLKLHFFKKKASENSSVSLLTFEVYYLSRAFHD